MAISISINQWKTSTRPCGFSLCLTTESGGVVFADFDSDGDNRVAFRRVSFDGYGCYETNGECTRMSAGDSDELIHAVRLNDVNTHHVHDILLRYFEENSGFVWRVSQKNIGSLPCDRHTRHNTQPESDTDEQRNAPEPRRREF